MNNTVNTIVQYLQYLWKRKWMIILVTVLFAALGYVYEKTKFQETYRGSALIFTGNANNDGLTKPQIQRNIYKNQLPETLKFDFTLPGNYQVLITIDGTNSEEVEKNLNEISNDYIKRLEANFKRQAIALEESRDDLEKSKENIAFLEENMDYYTNQVKEAIESGQDTGPAMEEFSENQKLLIDYKIKYHRDNKKLSKLEEPVLADVSVIPVFNKPFLNPLTAAALGFQLMIVFLVLYKLFTDLLKADRKREAKS
jgi:hypothetical protein